MKVLLIAPPKKWVHGMVLPRVGLPLNLLYVAAPIRDEHKVSVHDCTLKRKFAKTLHGFSHFGESWSEVKDAVQKVKPDVVGVSNISSMQFTYAVKTCEVVKEADLDITTVVGGPHATVRPQDFLKHGCVDYTVGGEGEYSFKELLGKLESGASAEGVLGVGFRGDGVVKVNPPRPPIKGLDELPYPAYGLIDLEEYFRVVAEGYGTRPDQFSDTSREIPFITSRGCPYNCVFCSVYCHMGRGWRPNSPEYVLNHLKLLADEYGVEHVHFEDDNLILDRKRFDVILDGLGELGLSWDTPNGVRADQLDRRLLSRMKETGLTQLKVGVESAQKHILEGVIDKKLDLRRVEESARLCKELSIPLGAFFVIGFPGETKDDMKATLDYALMLLKRYGTRPHIAVAVPYYGTRLYEECKTKGYLTREPVDDADLTYSLTEGIIKTEEFTPKELRAYVRGLYRRVLAHYVLKTVKNPKEFFGVAAYGLKNFRNTLRVIDIGINYYLRY